MAERLVLRLLGAFEAEIDEQPVTHFEAVTARALLAYLATHRRQPALRAHLAAVLWGVDLERTGLTNLRSALRRVRNALDMADVTDAEGDGGTSCLLTDRESVQFRPDLLVEVDIEQFDNLLRAVDGHSHTSIYECPDCVARYRRAVDLYRGPFLADLSIDSELFEQWRTALQERYRRQVLQALHVLAEHEFRLGSFAAAEVLARRQLEIEHWNEESHRQLMRILLASGRRSAALAQYEICRQVLEVELGAVPSEETDLLYDRIVAGVAPPAPVQSYNPYKGLEAFAIEDSAYFYGREVMTDRLLAAVSEQPLVALIGASGSGKSSLLHAGLAACLAPPVYHRKHGTGIRKLGEPPLHPFAWRIGSLRPGAAPLVALTDALLACGYVPAEHSSLQDQLRHGEIVLADVAAALDAAPARMERGQQAGYPAPLRLLLLVDQFEELFTHCRDVQVRHAFLRFLLHPAKERTPAARVTTQRHEQPEGNAVVVLAMRADFLGQALQYRDFADALQEHTVLLGPMVRAELMRAIEEPARLQGAALEPGLVDRLLDDVGAEPGRLPLLQFALALLWLRQQDGWLTHATYDEIGGLRGALTDYADDVYLSLSLAEQQAVRRVFLGLVEPGLDAPDVRHLATRAELGDDYWPVVQRLADARLVVTNTNSEGEETAELAHEALIREWRRLRDWLESDREFRRWQQQARIAAEHWRTAGEDESALLYGGRQAEAERWLNERHADVFPLVQRFITAGIVLREQRTKDELARQQRELEQVQAAAAADRRLLEAEQAGRRRLRRLTIFVALASCLAAGAALLAWQAQRRAEDNARVAHARQVAAQAVSAIDSNLDLALLLSREALRLDGAPESQTTLFRELDVDPRLLRILHGEDSALNSLAMAPRGAVIASNDQGAVVSWDVARGDRTGTHSAPSDVPTVAAVSPTGDRFVTTAGNAATIWDAEEFTPLVELAGRNGDLTGVSFTRDGSRLITVDDESLVSLWNVADGAFVRDLLVAGDRTVYGPVNALGTVILVDESDTTQDVFVLWDAEAGAAIGQPLVGHTDAVNGFSVSPDGKLLVTASFDGTVRLWDAATGAPVGEPLEGHSGRVLFAAFSPDGQMLVTGGTDGKAILWSVAARTQIGAPLQGHSNWVRGAAFSRDGHLLATGDEAGNVLLWDLSRQQWLAGHTDRVRSVALSPDQQTLVTSGFDGRLIIWDAATLVQRQKIVTPHARSIISIEFSPDGRTLVSVAPGGEVVFWDTTSWEPRYGLQIVPDDAVLIDLAFSPDGKTLAAGAFDGIIRFWNADTGAMLPRTIPAYTTGWALSVAFDPTGRLLATGGEDGVIKLWDAATGEPFGPPLTGHTNKVTDLVFDAEGRTLASASVDSTLRMWTIGDAGGAPAGEPLVSGSDQIWNVVESAAVPGTYITLGGDGSIAWWNAKENELLRPLLRTHLETEEMKLAADGQHFYLASTVPLAVAVVQPPDDWETLACDIANRSLTEEEWAKYMNQLPYDPACK